MIMAKTSIQDLPYGSPANITEPAVVMHEGRGGNDLKQDNTADLPTRKEIQPAQGPASRRASSQKDISKSQNAGYKTVESGSHQRHSSDQPAREPNVALQAALRRLKGTSSSRRNKSTDLSSASSTTSQPVLVRTYSASTAEAGSSKQAKMEKHRRSKINTSYDLPPLESFSFQDILASIDPEVRLSIDAIAEICGRSKMSMADEYDSHRPPQGELTYPHQENGLADILPTLPNPAQEYSSPPLDHDRRNSASLALVGTPSQKKTGISSTSTAATSNVNSDTYSESSTHEPPNTSEPHPDAQSSILPHVLTWIRRSSASFTGSNGSTTQVERDPTAALHRILTKTKEMP